ncbi:sodium/proton-translocating pyrophosphatase, partial [Myxococcota bacterium]|nr:sodium/proton-translocating pyrophosphatase [Myxococcota bacterium]
MQWVVFTIPVFGLAALVFAYFKTNWINKQDEGTDKMKEIAGYVREGAMAFLKAEYRVLVIFVIGVAILLAAANFKGGKGLDYKSPLIALSFIVGALCSALAGFIGMRVATKANVRTTAAARTSLNKALAVAFSGGTVMGMAVTGLAIMGLGLLMVLYYKFKILGGAVPDETLYRTVQVISGFSLGASSIALFARVGGGIYTKAADVGADLVGKVEAGIPEDDPRNPATIADNVGDNVGDVAGMGADLFESYVGAIIGAMVLAFGAVWVSNPPSDSAMFRLAFLPLMLAGVGVIVSIMGTFAVRTSEGGSPQKALNTGTFGAAALMVFATAGICYWFIPQKIALPVLGMGTVITLTWWKVFLATVVGLGAGILVGITTE